jgi:HK97 family phage major capsid protein
MNEYSQVMDSVGELRKTLETRLDDCLTKEKAEKLIESIVSKLHPAKSQAVVPGEEEILTKAESFKNSPRNTSEKRWTSEYGRKFGSMRNFLLAIKEKQPSIYAAKASTLVEGTASLGGYLVPSEFSSEVVELMSDISKIMEISNVIPMSSWKRQIPKQLTNVTVGWVDESGTKPETNPTFGQIEQVAKVMAAVIKCSDELLRDSAINLTKFLSELVAEAMALEIERVALIGDETGASDPFNGIYKTSGVNVVSMAGASVSFDDIAELIFSLNDAYAKDATMILSRTGLKKLIKLKDSQNNYIWQPPTGDVAATIWNTPYVISSQIPNNLGVGTDETLAIFGRFNKYLLISPRQELEVKVSQDASDSAGNSAFMTDQTWLRFAQALSIDVAHGAAFSYLQFK